MKKNFFLTLMLLLLALFNVQHTAAQAPVATPEQAITALLNRIGGDGAAGKFEIVIDASLAEDGKDVFIITSQNGKPCIKGNTQLSVATGINWYLNHYAHINLTWNNLTTDLSGVELPVPTTEDKHVCNTTYRYNFNTCTFSYSMAFWTWERWQKEIDWMALHGINAPLNLVGLEVVTRKFLEEIGMSEDDIKAYIAGPGFMAWFAMNNLEGWGSTVNATDVTMNGNPDWWYTRQEQLCRDMMQRMRELGMQPVIPGFSGQVPYSLRNYNNIADFSPSDIVTSGAWGGFSPHPGVVNPSTTSYQTLATIYYKHLHDVMGVSEFYSMDPFHEMTAPVAANVLYPGIMENLDRCYALEGEEEIAKFNAPANPKWIVQQWQGTPVSGAFSAMSSYGNRFIGLDLFSDAPGKAKWNSDYYQGRPYIFCMLHNFGGRSGMHGRLESVMNDYFSAIAKNNNCQGIGATPEGTETNPILYDMLFELPWMDVSNRPTVDEWLEDYAYARYGVDAVTAPKALFALRNLKNSVWACPTDQQGTSEAVILARPAWTVNSVSTWSTSAIYWDTQDVRLAADELISIADLVTTRDGIKNYDYDVIDVIRQSMVDFAAELLPLIKAAHTAGNTAEYTRLYQLYLQLMLDLDTMLSYDENFKLERWTSLARNIANEATGTDVNDRNWLEWNARTQVTVWSYQDCDLHDYSNRCWAGLIKDFHYERWKYFFENNGAAPGGGWFSGFEHPWTVNFTDYDYSTIDIPTDMTATQKAVETFGKYFGRVKGATKNYLFPMGVSTDATESDVIPEVYRGQTVTLPLAVGNGATVSSVQIDFNGDGSMGNAETLTATGMNVEIPATATIGKTKAIVAFSDGTVVTFNLAIIVDITADRTVTAATADANMGTVAIEGTSELTITNQEAVKITATANTGYNFKNWTDAGGNVVSNDNPYIYYGETDASFTANFVEDLWGVVACNGTFSGDITGYAQFIHNLTFTYFNREAETILETTTAPTQIFNTIPQIINVPRGASFDVYYDDGSGDGLKYCYFRAYIDLNADGDFDDEGELLKEVGTNGDANTAVCSNKINVLLPYDAPLGITHMRLRFDGAWDNSNNPSGRGAKDASIRPVYEIILNITEGSNKAAHVTVESNSDEWGTAEVWTDETPDGSTGSEWDVSVNIPLYLRATPASADVDFLGWYDHYGRLLTTESEYSMLAKEDATYTARFRKLLDIDGWQIEYRTEPGTDIKYYSTTALANGESPVGGKKYYIAAHTLSNGSYYNRYLYDNNGTLATSTTLPANCVWTCIDNGDGTFSFKNESGNYLANTGDYYISIGTTAAKYTFAGPSHEGVTLTNAASYNGGKCMVTKHDGTAFNRYTNAANDGSWSSDYLFYEGIVPDNIILTEVRSTGNNDLVIPETVEILGEQCTIVGFDNGLFNNNTELWSITLPETMEFVSSNVQFRTSVAGTNTPTSSGDTNPDNFVQVIDLGGLVLKNNEAWEIVASFESDGVSTYNQWGTPLLNVGSTGSGTELFYLSSVNSWSTCWHVRSPFSGLGNDYFKTHTDTKISTFTVALENKGTGKAVLKVTNSEGETMKSSEVTFSDDNIAAFSAKLPKGLNITDFRVLSIADPFTGCTNLDKIAIDGTCANYYVNNSDGGLYNSSDVLVSMPAGKEKGTDRRALAALIEDMRELTAQVGTFDPVGKKEELPLSVTEDSDYYIYSNATISEGELENLLDEDNESYIHTTWTANSVDGLNHYLRVYMGETPSIDNFQFSYVTRNNGNTERPKQMTVSGSNVIDGEYDTIAVLTELPNEKAKEYISSVYSARGYKYLRFMVDDTHRDLGNSGHKAYSMAKFDLYKVTSSADVFPVFDGTELTDDFAAARYDVLLNAIYVFENGTTAEEMQKALTALQTAYDELEDKLNNALPFKLTTDEETPVLYKIFIKRTADVTVLQYDEASNKVAVVNKADNKSYQAWYFMQSTNGFVIKPYNAMGKVLSASSTANNPGTVTVQEPGAETFYEWKLVARTDGYYNIQVHNGSNYFSNNGGTSQKMGFWSGDPAGDTGSLFKFVEASFENDNPRYYQLKDYMEYVNIDGSNIYGGTGACLYTGGAEYREAYNVAAPLNTAGNTSDAAECYAAYKALRPAAEGLSYNAIDPNKAYYIISAATNSNTAYCQGKYVYSPNQSLTRTRGNYTGKHNHTHLIFDAFADIAPKAAAAFSFVETGTAGEYKMKSLNNDLYVKAFSGTHLGTEAEAATVKITPYADGSVTLKIGNNSPMHAQNDYGVIVQWGADAGNASLWTIEEADVEDFNYTLNVPESGVATLYLPYNVVLPTGVTAYSVKTDDILPDLDNNYYYDELVEVATAGEKLAKSTPVIIKAAEGVYTLTATLDDTDARSATSPALVGTYYAANINSDDTYKLYSVATEESVPVFNAITAETEALPNSSWLSTSVECEKITAKVEPQDVEVVDGGVYRIHGRLSNGTLRTLYNNGSNNRIVWTTEEKDDVFTLFIAQAGADGKFKLVSALGNGIWSQDAELEETGVELSFSAGSVNGTTMIVGSSNRRFNVFGSGVSGSVDFYSNCTADAGAYVTESQSTNFVLEPVDDATQAKYSLKMKKSYEWSTLYLPYAVTVPAGIDAYIATQGPAEVNGENVIELTEVENVIPERTAVVLKRESAVVAETFNFVYAKDAEMPYVAGNIFEGRITEGYIGGDDMASKNFYILFRGNEGERLYWIYKEYDATGNNVGDTDNGYIKCAANKAYLALDAVANNASSYSFRFGGTTGVEEVKVESGEMEVVYDLQGRKLTEITEPGVYIIDGNKVLVK